jgi:hypothetical protein
MTFRHAYIAYIGILLSLILSFPAHAAPVPASPAINIPAAACTSSAPSTHAPVRPILVCGMRGGGGYRRPSARVYHYRRPRSHYNRPHYNRPSYPPKDDEEEEDRPTTSRQTSRTPLDDFRRATRFGTPSRHPNPPTREAAKNDILKRFFEISEGGTPEGWPKNLSSANAFWNLGLAMTKMDGFPTGGTQFDKLKFVYLHMDLVAQTYDLEAGTGYPLSQAIVGINRACGLIAPDPEEAESLKKGDHLGNCAEWSQAFSSILAGAGVVAHVVYADMSCKPGKSLGFGGTDTTVIFEERDFDGRISRRVFDVFQAAHRSSSNMPTAETLWNWGNLPLTDADRWKGEIGPSWLKDMVRKPCVKDGSSESVLVDPTARLSPSTVDRPTVSWDGGRRPGPAPGCKGGSCLP